MGKYSTHPPNYSILIVLTCERRVLFTSRAWIYVGRAQDIDPMLLYSWADVLSCGPTMSQSLARLCSVYPRVKVSIVGSLRDREVACSASDRQGSNF